MPLLLCVFQGFSAFIWMGSIVQGRSSPLPSRIHKHTHNHIVFPLVRLFFSYEQKVLAMDRFHGEALAALEHPTEGRDETIGEWLAKRGYHESIVGGWIVPFCAAVWSSPTAAAGAMNARALFGFL